MKLVGVSRQLAITMAAIAIGAALLIVTTSIVFYYFSFKYWPDDSGPDYLPSLAETIWLLSTTLAGVALAIVVAGHLAKRILIPLNSVAEGIRRVATGDLTARAVAEPSSLREAAMLVDNFNHLASQLQRVTDERKFWNAAIAHELRTPVTILRGRIQGFADGVFEADQSQFRRLLAQVEALGRLIEDLRAVSLAESGHLSLQWEETDLAYDVQEAAEAFREGFASKGQHAVCEVSVGRVRCDPIRIRQALLALFDNARRYAVPGAIVIRASQSNDVCLVSVEDEGPGIPAELIPHVFEAFRHAESGYRSDERGSGLGLAVVAAIAHAHGGRVRCVASSSGGTRFELEWPTATVTQPWPATT